MVDGNNNRILGTAVSFYIIGSGTYKDESGYRRIKGQG